MSTCGTTAKRFYTINLLHVWFSYIPSHLTTFLHFFPFFPRRNQKLTIHWKCTHGVLTLFFVPLSFCNEAVQVQEQIAFLWPAHVNLSCPMHVNFHNGFLGDCSHGPYKSHDKLTIKMTVTFGFTYWLHWSHQM